MSEREPGSEAPSDEATWWPDGNAPWWESGEAPEGIALPTRRGHRVVVVVAVVAAVAGLALIVWGIAVGASSMGSMPM